MNPTASFAAKTGGHSHMTQVQNMQKRYSTPVLAVYGRFEDVTMIWSNPTAFDNVACLNAVGSQTPNSGVLCVPPPPNRRNDADPAVIDPSIVSPTIEDPLAAPIDPLAEAMTGGNAGS